MDALTFLREQNALRHFPSEARRTQPRFFGEKPAPRVSSGNTCIDVHLRETTSIHVPRIIRNTGSLQKLVQLFRERFFAVMLLLPLDVPPDRLPRRCAHCKRRIPLLPLEPPLELRIPFSHPRSRRFLQFPHTIRQTNRRPHRHKHMHMVRHTPNPKGMRLHPLQNPPNVRMQIPSPIPPKARLPILGRKNHMIMQSGIRGGHTGRNGNVKRDRVCGKQVRSGKPPLSV